MEEALDLLLKDVSAIDAGPATPRGSCCAPRASRPVADHDFGHVVERMGVDTGRALGAAFHWKQEEPLSPPPRSETVRHPGAVALDRTQAGKVATGARHRP